MILKNIISGISYFWRKRLEKIIFQTTQKMLTHDNMLYSPIVKLRFKAQEESCSYIIHNMPSAVLINSITDSSKMILDYALKKVTIDGLYCEFGVFSGKSVNIIADQKTDKTIYGFDSFEGLPEDWQGWALQQGVFSVIRLPKVKNNVKLIKGWFKDTLPGFINEHPDTPLAFLHVDSDLYSSAVTIFDHFKKHIKAGTVIVFDEYYNYPNWQEHEYKAFKEFREKYSVQYEYIAAGYQQVAVVIKNINNE